MRRIAALVPNILGVAPGQRVRIESWAQHLPRHGWEVDFYPFESDELRRVLYQPGHSLAKARGMAGCYLRQLRRVYEGLEGDLIFIYREAALVGPALLERLAARLRVPLVFDLDDPTFLPYRSPTSGWFSLLKFSRKTHALFGMSDHVITINRLIGDYAAKYNPAVSVIPNYVDTEVYRPAPAAADGPVRLAWTGSLSTMANLKSIAAPLRRLQSAHRAPLRVVGVGDLDLPGVDAEMRQWSAATEIPDLQECHVGLVPVPDHPWNSWKFFLKAVQYMALGLPVVARRIGSNSEVIQDGVNGFLVETEDEWHDRLVTLVTDPELRRRMGAAARATALEKYSVHTQIPRVAEVFERVWEGGRRGRRALSAAG